MIRPAPALVLAYGSNLPWRRMAARIEATPLVVGRLPRHELRFNKVSIDGSGKANVVPVATPGTNVWGAIYELPPDQLPRLDRCEGRYLREPLQIETEGGRLNAWVYRAEPDAVQEGLQPYDWYLEHVRRGARERGLPGEWVDWLDQVPHLPDPDRARFEAERAIHLDGG